MVATPRGHLGNLRQCAAARRRTLDCQGASVGDRRLRASTRERRSRRMPGHRQAGKERAPLGQQVVATACRPDADPRPYVGGQGTGAGGAHVSREAGARLAPGRDLVLSAAQLAAGVARVRGVHWAGTRTGNWLSQVDAQRLLDAPIRPPGRGCATAPSWPCCSARPAPLGDRRPNPRSRPPARRPLGDRRPLGKHHRVCSVPMPSWTRVAIDAWTKRAGIGAGRVFRSLRQGDGAGLDAETQHPGDRRRGRRLRRTARHRHGAPRPSAHLRQAGPEGRRAARADPAQPGPRLDPRHRALPRVSSRT